MVNMRGQNIINGLYRVRFCETIPDDSGPFIGAEQKKKKLKTFNALDRLSTAARGPFFPQRTKTW